MSGEWRPSAMILATLMAVGGVAMLAAGGGPGLLIVSALMVTGLLAERTYRSPSDRPPVGGNWRSTGERFVDPETGRATRVWYDPDSGERRYVADDRTAP